MNSFKGRVNKLEQKAGRPADEKYKPWRMVDYDGQVYRDSVTGEVVDIADLERDFRLCIVDLTGKDEQ